MSSRETFLSQFNMVPFFTNEPMEMAAKRFEIPKNTLVSYIQRSIKDKTLIRLKRGLYTTAFYFNNHRSNVEYVYTTACKLLEPSYISRESALQYYGVLSEAANMVITLVTTQTTRRFANRLGIMDYKNISPRFFGGFEPVQKDNGYFMAKPYKAIFDYLYYRIPIADLRSKDRVLHYLDEFRLDYEILSRSEVELLFKFIEDV